MAFFGFLRFLTYRLLAIEMRIYPRSLTFAYVLVALLLFLITLSLASDDQTHGTSDMKCVTSERRALLSFKHGLRDDSGMLSSWEMKENDDCCKWVGVECNNFTNHVVKIDLRGSENRTLSGEISTSLLELPHLSYLDLSSNPLGNEIPEQIGSHANLIYLNFSYCNLVGSIPPHLGNLSNLKHLDLGGNQMLNVSDRLEWLSSLSSLSHINLNYVNLSSASDWQQAIANLPHLEVLLLHLCDLPEPTTPFPQYLNFSNSLVEVDLSFNNLPSSIFPWLFNSSNSLTYLDLSLNYLDGMIPTALRNMPGISYLDLSFNNFHGGISDAFGNMSSLRHIDFSCNNFSGSIPRSLGQLSNLEVLKLIDNSLEGEVSEVQFSLLTKLQVLGLSFNSLALNFQLDWNPPFQLNRVFLRSCKLGPYFPNWLRTQKRLTHLSISNANISDFIPRWFWNLTPRLAMLDLSGNEIKGKLPDLPENFFKTLGIINLRSNQLEGQIPSFLFQTKVLDLSSNKFSGYSLTCGTSSMAPLVFLDLSNNQLSGVLPDCWPSMPNLKFLGMKNNDLSGNIPRSISNSTQLEAIFINNNKFSGELPYWLANFKTLVVFNGSGNGFSGPIPGWIGNGLSNLTVLSLQSNQFSGKLPSSICNLSNVKILDISSNTINGSIPNCICTLKALTTSTIPIPHKMMDLPLYHDVLHTLPFDHLSTIYFMDAHNDVLEWKGRDQILQKARSQIIKNDNLFGKQLTEIIFQKIPALTPLVTLNLSRNNLTGHVPEKTGQLQLLQALDLSRNQLSGEIPSSLSQMDRLQKLDLSYNKLSGKIPVGTQLQSFSASSYEGNSKLCGSPLPKCFQEEPSQSLPIIRDENESVTPGLYVSIALGFIFGFCVYFVIGCLK